MSMATDNASQSSIRVGFIGCGEIACAIAQGIVTQTEIPVRSICVSKRSESRSKALQEKFPELVRIDPNNQAIADESDIIFLCVLPEQASKVLQAIKLDPERHTLVSLVSTASLESLVMESQLPPKQVSKMICLPSVAHHQGVCLHCCADDGTPSNKSMLEKLFDAMGGCLTLESEEQLNTCMSTTCIMGPLYGMMRRNIQWLVRRGGLSPKDANFLVTKQYLAVLQDAERDCETNPNRVSDLINAQTPGGLNEQALGNWENLGGLETYDQVMDAVLERIEGTGDGSV